MFQEMHNLQQEVKCKQARFQAQATQERLIKSSMVARQPPEIPGQPEIKRSWLLALRMPRQQKRTKQADQALPY